MLTPLIVDIFASLNQDFEYAVLRGYEALPEQLTGSDIDLVMRADDFLRFRRTFQHILIKHGFKLLAANINDRFATLVVACVRDASLEALQLDFFFNFSLKGTLFMTAEEVLARRLFNGKIHHVGLVDEVLEKLLNVTLLGHAYPAKYQEKLEKAICDEGMLLNQQLAEIFNDKQMDIRHCQPVMAKRLRRQAFASARRRYGFQAWLQKLKFFTCTFLAYLSHNGLWLCFTGPDGSGKTTVLELVSAELAKAFREVTMRHFRPDFLPRLATVGKGCGIVGEVDVDYASPHRGGKTNTLSSLVRFVYYALDYVLGYWLQVKRPLFNRSCLIFDRYYTDIISDSRRSKIWLDYRFIFALRKLIPWPDFTFIIHVEPQRILTRKQELGLAQIIEIYHKLDYMADQDPSFTQIDNNGPAHQAVAQILTHILDARAAHYEPFWK
jgi:thymidylate kinase